MERQLEAAETYSEIRRLMREAEALKVLLSEVAAVKQEAEWVVLRGNQRIAEELEKIPKAAGRPSKILPLPGKNKSGKAATGIKHTSRSRLKKLKDVKPKVLRKMAEQLWETGKDATVKAIIGEVKTEEIRQNRKAFEKRRKSGGTLSDLQALIDSGQRFPVIYADPPWTFKVYSGKGKARSAERHYDTASLDSIKALPIGQLATDNSALLIWAVWPEIGGALDVIEAWGFEYKTVGFVWVKTVSETNDDLHTGMGYWTRANTEVCLLATRGSPQRQNKDVHQVIMAPVGEHSAKPEEARRRIERLLIGDYLEAFGRKPVPGWTVWGNEVGAKEAAE
jgi:N6-adenosine-specific RNA methylase IME4